MAEDKHEHVTHPKKHILLNNFIGGFAWGLGAIIGLSLIVAILGLLAKYVDLVPIVGTFVGKVVTFILQNNPQLVK